MNSYSFNLSLPVVKEPRATEKATTPTDIALILADTAKLAQESFTVLTLNTKYQVIDRHLVSLGTVDSCLVHAREVFRPAIADGATAIVVSHNHPSGNPTPSAEDIRVTRQLVDAGKIIGIDVLDHVIIGRGTTPYASLRESGLVDFA